MIKKCAWFVLFVLMTASCLDEPDCYQLNNYIIGISFKKLADSKTDTVAFTRFGTVEPPLLFSNDTTVSRLYLPLNYFTDETTYFFDTPAGTKTLQLGYVSQAQFVSENCGEKFVLSKLHVLQNSFDSVRLVSDTPTQAGSAIQLEVFQ